MRFLFAVMIVLTAGLLAQRAFDSDVAAWVAVGSLIVIIAMRSLGSLGLWPADWPDVFGDGD